LWCATPELADILFVSRICGDVVRRWVPEPGGE
jgi:hypothetical protein